MEVRKINNKKIWEDFFLGCEEKTFLQSWNWGEFQKMIGNKIWRLGIYDNENNEDPISAVLVVKVTAKRGTFLMVQHGPTINQKSKIKNENEKFKNTSFYEAKAKCEEETKSLRFLKSLLNELKKIAKKESCNFIRVVPLLKRSEENIKFFKELGFREAPMHANAYEATLKLNLKLLEEELLMNMRKTTRYLIRQAQKNPEIEIIKSAQIEDIQIYDKLNQKTAERQQFVPFSFEFVKNEFDVFTKDNQVLLFFGKYQSKIVAASLIVFWSGIAFYHQAASLNYKIPIAYLLQWEAIKEAKKRGCDLYDFWGYVDPKKEPKHPWAGPTLFKLGFGSKSYKYLKTQDLPISWRYWLTYIFEKLRKIKRGL